MRILTFHTIALKVLPLAVITIMVLFAEPTWSQSLVRGGDDSGGSSKSERRVQKRASAGAALAMPEQVLPTVGPSRGSMEGSGQGRAGVVNEIAQRSSLQKSKTAAIQSMRCNPGKSPDRFGQCR